MSATLEGREAGSSVPWTACAPGSPEQEATPGCGILSGVGSLSGFAWNRRAGAAPKWACQGDKLGGERGPRENEGTRRSESKCGASRAEEGPGTRGRKAPAASQTRETSIPSNSRHIPRFRFQPKEKKGEK